MQNDVREPSEERPDSTSTLAPARPSDREATSTLETTARRIVALLLVALIGGVTIPAAPAGAQEADRVGTVTGQIVGVDAGDPLSGVTVQLQGEERGTVSNESGRYLLQGIPAGTYTLEVSALGYRTITRTVDVAAGGTAEADFSLELRPVEVGGINVSVLRPDMQPQAELTEREVQRANPKDAGQVLRSLTGVEAVRRGPLGLDPVVRGLRETEIGTYLDGTRQFPQGPARMDSPLTHLDPSAISDIQVVKGPYALTWGAGNMSAIRVETEALPERGARVPRGSLNLGYDSNLQATETYGNVSGRSGGVSYWLHGAWRDGGDYETGTDELVPGDFRSWEGRGKVGVDVGENSILSVSGGYQDQGPMDYPGRLLNADLFETANASLRWQTERSEGALRNLEVLAYRNDGEHVMGNWEKPTAEPMEGRMPPFAIDVTVDSSIDVRGGRSAADLTSGPWNLRVGGDVYSANRNAVRTIARQDNGMVMFEDLMWPDATITNGGLFTRVGRSLGENTRFSGTVRLDVVRARADTASEFFLDNVSQDLKSDEANLSGAMTVGYDLMDGVSLSVGLGSVVRTADATERYSDRIPSSKAQTSAEFVGNPTLNPERSTQADLWFEGSLPDLAFQINAFARRVDDYITLEATELEKRLPLSPETVYRYVNGEATFWGTEASATYGLTEVLTAQIGGSYLRARDETVDEPALGIAPLDGRLGLRYEETAGRYFLEGTLHAVGEQDRVAAARGETPTDGYTTMDLRAGWAPGGGVNIRLGVENLLDEGYVNHLNAKNPFTGNAIPEPGRVLFVDLSYRF